jgi:hypothetical protein
MGALPSFWGPRRRPRRLLHSNHLDRDYSPTMPRGVVLLSSGGSAGYGVSKRKLLAAAGFRSSPRVPRQTRKTPRSRQSAPRRRGSAVSSGDPPGGDEPPLAPTRRVTDKSHSLVCEVCGQWFISRRSDARTCGNRCRQQAFRDRQAEERLAALEVAIEPQVFLDAADGDPLLALDLAIREPQIRQAFRTVAA